MAPPAYSKYARKGQKKRKPPAYSTLARGDMRNWRKGGFSGVELKNFDFAHTDTIVVTDTASGGVTDPASANCLYAPVVGTGPNQRIGRKTRMQTIQFEGYVVLKQTSFPASGVNLARAKRAFVAIVMDTQSNAAQMTSQLVYKNVAISDNMAADPIRSLERVGRFKVLKQWHMDIGGPVGVGNSTGAQGTVFTSKRLSYFGKLDTNVEHIGSAGTIGDIQDNSLHVIAFTTEGGFDFTAKIHYQGRIRFTG